PLAERGDARGAELAQPFIEEPARAGVETGLAGRAGPGRRERVVGRELARARERLRERAGIEQDQFARDLRGALAPEVPLLRGGQQARPGGGLDRGAPLGLAVPPGGERQHVRARPDALARGEPLGGEGELQRAGALPRRRDERAAAPQVFAEFGGEPKQNSALGRLSRTALRPVAARTGR